MIVVYAALGLLAGSVVNWATHVVPRFARAPMIAPAVPAAHFESAVLALLVSRRILPLSLGVELACAGLFAVVGSVHGWTASLALPAGLCALFVLIAATDIRYRLVPDILTLPAIGLVLLASLLSPRIDEVTTLLGGALGFGLFAVVALLRPGDLGGGDVKLAAFIGLLFGFPYGLWALLVGVLAGGVASMALIFAQRWSRVRRIPYAPFLCLGAVVALLYNPLPM